MSTTAIQPELATALVERVLHRLGIEGKPEPGMESLSSIYEAWCRNVPFDNIRKLIHISRGDQPPFPGDSPEDFLNAWLKYGTGGTCWAGNGALAALLQSLGFNATRALGTMLVAPDLPPNHGTVVVTMNDQHYVVDASILHLKPLLLDPLKETFIDHPSRGVRCTPRDGKWYILWLSTHQPEPFECRIDSLSSDANEFATRHEATRTWSPFNYNAYARVIRGEEMLGLANGTRICVDSAGQRATRDLALSERREFLIREIRISEELVAQLPEDQATPPPPKP